MRRNIMIITNIGIVLYIIGYVDKKIDTSIEFWLWDDAVVIYKLDHQSMKEKIFIIKAILEKRIVIRGFVLCFLKVKI